MRFGPEDKQLWLGESVLLAEYSLHLVTLPGFLFMGHMISEHSETPSFAERALITFLGPQVLFEIEVEMRLS